MYIQHLEVYPWVGEVYPWWVGRDVPMVGRVVYLLLYASRVPWVYTQPPYHAPWCTLLGIPGMLHAPRCVLGVGAVLAVPDGEALGSLLRLIRKTRRI